MYSEAHMPLKACILGELPTHPTREPRKERWFRLKLLGWDDNPCTDLWLLDEN